MNDPIHPYAVYTVKEVAKLLKVQPVTVQRYIRSGKLKATLFGKIYRVSGQAVLDVMALDSEAIKMSLDRVRQTENAVAIKSKVFLLDDLKGKEYLRLVDETINVLISILNPDYSSSTEDGRTLQYIGVRLFDSAVSAFDECLRGYYQVSFSMQRDLIEGQFLLDLFNTYPEKIKEWREGSDETLREKFSPKVIRKLLDDRDGFHDKKRGETYAMYCKYASHMTYSGFTLLTNDFNQVEIGPFFNEKKLLNCMYSLALNYAFATVNLVALLKIPNIHVQKLAMDHIKLFYSTFPERIKIAEELKKRLDEFYDYYSEMTKEKR